EEFFEMYKPGTTPGGLVDEAGVEEIKTLMLSTIYQLEQDYNEEIFTGYPTFTTRYGVEISSIKEAIKFLTFHDGLHMGYIMALKRAI
ncbi:MAG: DinB family protein, partial [Mucilaginibacter sp.]